MDDLFPFNLAEPPMILKPAFVAVLLLSLSACVLPPHAAGVNFRDPAELRAATFADELARIAVLSPEQRRRELADLDAGHPPDASRQFRRAALLEREDDVEALERSHKILAAITPADDAARALIELMKRALKARIVLAQEAQRAQALEQKLEQIKALEKSLQQRSAPARKQ